MDVEAPLGTAVAGGIKHGVVAAFMQKFAGNGKGVDPEEPLHTVMAGAPRHAVVAPTSPSSARRARAASSTRATPSRSRLHDRPEGAAAGRRRVEPGEAARHLRARPAVDEPLHTISARGTHMAEVRAFLIKYYGIGPDGHTVEDPIGAVTGKDRFGLVTVTIEGEEYVIVDIGMRMLTPRELFNAQGFPPDYIIDRDAEGRPITKTAQVAKCGNSVCPPIARALVAANAVGAVADNEAEAA
jgi:DNA (cytosine-5)-methyltransferase 1